jgi:hypothetical protein
VADSAISGCAAASVQARPNGLARARRARAEAAILYNHDTGKVLWRVELAGSAVDCQHHQGDDGNRVSWKTLADLSERVCIDRNDVRAARRRICGLGTIVVEGGYLLHLL